MSVNLSKIKEMEVINEENQTLKSAQQVAPVQADEEDFSSELNQPCWSVITYKSIAASHLTYNEAVQWAEDLKKQGVSGLCVITDDAATRIAER